MQQFSKRVQAFSESTQRVFEFFTQSTYARHQFEPGIADFAIGNPHEMPLTRFVEALQGASAPQNKDWFAYKMNERPSQQIVAASLKETHQLAFEPDDILMTNGAFAALSVALNTITDPGDEVIFISPPWFFYEPLILAVDAPPVRVKVNMENFDLDIDAIAAAITPKTRAIIVNSPNNPTGKIYPPETLMRLAAVLTEASQRNRATNLSALRRSVQAHRLRWCDISQPCGVLPEYAAALYLRQNSAHARSATRLHRPSTDHA